MKTPKVAALVGALMAVTACAETSGPWRMINKPVAAGPTCADFITSIYFDQDSAALTPEAKMALKGARAQARGCQVRSVKVVGLADAVGASQVNLALSKRRADIVSAALADHGFGKAEFDLTALGDAGAVSSSGAAAPLRRRADIRFELSPAGR